MKKPAIQSCKNIQILELHIRFPTNEYVDLNQIHHYFPIMFKTKTSTVQDIDPNMIPVKKKKIVYWIRRDWNKEIGRGFADNSYFANKYI